MKTAFTMTGRVAPDPRLPRPARALWTGPSLDLRVRWTPRVGRLLPRPLTRDQEELLRRLVELAGSPLGLQAALKELTDESEAPALEDLARRIVEVREKEAAATADQ